MASAANEGKQLALHHPRYCDFGPSQYGSPGLLLALLFPFLSSDPIFLRPIRKCYQLKINYSCSSALGLGRLSVSRGVKNQFLTKTCEALPSLLQPYFDHSAPATLVPCPRTCRLCSHFRPLEPCVPSTLKNLLPDNSTGRSPSFFRFLLICHLIKETFFDYFYKITSPSFFLYLTFIETHHYLIRYIYSMGAVHISRLKC